MAPLKITAIINIKLKNMDRYNEALKASAVTEDDALVASQVA